MKWNMRAGPAVEREVKDTLESRHVNQKPSAPALIERTIRSDVEAVHSLREEWLRARVRGWMDRENTLVDEQERPRAIANWYIGSYVGRQWIFAATQDDRWSPGGLKENLARTVCRYINRESSHGGAWLVGWSRDGAWFYFLWKDADGDLQIEVAFNTAQANLTLDRLLGWSMEDFCEHCEQAIAAHNGWHTDMQYAKRQLKRVAQGER